MNGQKIKSNGENLDIYSIARVISNDNLYYFVCWYLLVVDHSYGGNFWIEISAVKNKGHKTDLKIPALWLVNIQLKKNKEIAVCFYSSDSCSILVSTSYQKLRITLPWCVQYSNKGPSLNDVRSFSRIFDPPSPLVRLL